MADMRQLAQVFVAVTIVVSLIPTFLGVVVFGGAAVPTQQQADLVPSSGSVTLPGENISDVSVQQSLNDSAQLDGSGAITGSLGDDVAANRTVSTWVWVDNTSGVRQVVSIDSRTILTYNGSTSDWACWSYDGSSGETHRVTVNATSPTTRTNLQCERASGTLSLRVNDTAVSAIQTDSANATAQTLQTRPLDGRVDETRVFNGTLSSSEQTQLDTEPTAPLESAPRQSRIMYDSYGSLDSVPVYIAGGTLDGTTATKAAGLQGQGAAEGTDWSRSGDTVTLLSGGTLEGAPVVFATYTAEVGGGVLPGGLGAPIAVLAALIPVAAIWKAIEMIHG
jgi:hypothetical protein